MCVLSLVAAALLRTAPSAAGTPVPSTQPKAAYTNIILITMDTTRADRMGFMGSKRGLTPNLDKLAQDSAVFTRAYTQAPFTPSRALDHSLRYVSAVPPGFGLPFTSGENCTLPA